MPQKTAYLDNSATTQVCPEAAQKAAEGMTACYGNPSSLHAMGMRAEAMMEQARAGVAGALGCRAAEIIFTSGGTESNNLALFGAIGALGRRGRRIVTTQIEHPSVLEAMGELERRGFEVVRLRPQSDGKVPEQLIYDAVNQGTILISMMAVNNETGAVQPVAAMKKAAVAAGAPALIHCDAVQAFCRLPMEPARLGIDLVSVSAHKIHGPKGTGALYMRSGARITPLLFGGGQEKGLRPGTHAVELIAAFGAAASVAAEGRAGFMREIAALRGYCLDRLVEIGGVTVNSPADAAPHILSISCEGIPSEVMLNHLSANGVYVSAGSACSRGARSHVLAAMALPEARAASALRISFSRFNTKEDVDLLCAQLEAGLATIKRAGKRH